MECHSTPASPHHARHFFVTSSATLSTRKRRPDAISSRKMLSRACRRAQAPALARYSRDWRWSLGPDGTLAAASPPDRQSFLLIDALGLLAVDQNALRATPVGQLAQLLAKLGGIVLHGPSALHRPAKIQGIPSVGHRPGRPLRENAPGADCGSGSIFGKPSCTEACCAAQSVYEDRRYR